MDNSKLSLSDIFDGSGKEVPNQPAPPPKSIMDMFTSEQFKRMESDITQNVHSDERVMLGHSPFEQYNSSPREMMKYVQLGQCLEVENMDARLLFSGVDMQYGEYCFKIVAPTTMQVISVHQLNDSMNGGFKYNNTTYVYYKDMDESTSEREVVGVLELSKLHLIDKSYGVTFIPTDDYYAMMEPGRVIDKDTPIYVSKAEAGPMDYRFGVQANTVAISSSENIQDGITISQSLVDRAPFKEYGRRRQSFGKKLIPLNLYGDPNKPEEYKIFPDIGEYSRPDGLLMAFREYDELTAPVDMTDAALRELRPTDYCVYGPKDTIARIIDVTVHYNESSRQTYLTPSMRSQTDRYVEAMRKTFSSIYGRLCRDRDRHHGLEVNRNSQEVMSWIYGNRTSMDRVDRSGGQPTVVKSSKGETLDEVTIELHYESMQTLANGKKLSNLGGGKGVAVRIKPDHTMPVDMFGNRAEVVISGDTYIKRMIGSALMELAITSIDQQMVMRLKEMYESKTPQEQIIEHYRKHIQIISPDYLRSLDEANASPAFDLWNDHIYPLIHEHEVGKFKHRLHLPITNPVKYSSAIPLLAKHNDYKVGSVQITNDLGEKYWSKSAIPIGSVYYIILEKTATDWTATDTAKRTPYNTPSKTSTKDKYAHPVRTGGTTTMSETEYRWWISGPGPDVAHNMVNISLSPESSRAYWNDWLSQDGYGIPKKPIDKIMRGMNRPTKLTLQILECQGVGFAIKGKRV